MLEWHLGLSSQRLVDWDKQQLDDKNAASTTLRTKWAANYDEKLALSNGLIKKFGSDALMEKIGSDPEAIEFLANLGSQLSEDKLGELGKSNMGMNAEQAKLEITKVMKTIMDTDQSDPTYKDLVQKKNALYKIAYPNKAPVGAAI